MTPREMRPGTDSGGDQRRQIKNRFLCQLNTYILPINVVLYDKANQDFLSPSKRDCVSFFFRDCPCNSVDNPRQENSAWLAKMICLQSAKRAVAKLLRTDIMKSFEQKNKAKNWRAQGRREEGEGGEGMGVLNSCSKMLQYFFFLRTVQMFLLYCTNFLQISFLLKKFYLYFVRYITTKQNINLIVEVFLGLLQSRAHFTPFSLTIPKQRN
jgi:hypothetical protein